MRDSLRHFAAEFIGTFALVFVGGAAIMRRRRDRIAGSSRSRSRTGSILAVMVSATMRISGHFNPAVTLGFLVDAPHRADDGRRLHRRAAARRRSLAAYALKALFPPTSRRRRGSVASRSRSTSSFGAGDRARGDRDVLPRVRDLRDGGRSAGAEDRRPRDRSRRSRRASSPSGRSPAVDESRRARSARRCQRHLRGTGVVLDRADHRRRAAALLYDTLFIRRGTRAGGSRRRAARRLSR